MPSGTTKATVGREPAKRSGSVLSALQNRDFRTLWAGSFASNIGTWMQNVAIGPYALALSKSPAHPRGSATFVAFVGLAQLGPVLVFAMVGGVLANRVSRKRLIICAQSVQMTFAFILAWLAVAHPTRAALVFCVLGTGIANALSAPAYQAVLPELVERSELPGVISLNSTSLNGSRVIGPLLLLVLRPFGVRTDTAHGLAAIFVINALTFLFSITAVYVIRMRPNPARPEGGPGAARLFDGIAAARRNPVAGRILLLLCGFSLVSLVYISQFPTIVERNLSLSSRSGTYSLLFGAWGLGAMFGSLAQATAFAALDKRRTIRWSFLAFAVALAAFALVRSVGPAFPVVFVLGFFYFGTTTAMMTVLQQHIADRERAPVMSLWMMAFGGTVPLGGLWGGWAMDHWSVSGVMLIGAAAAVLLAATSDLYRRSERMRAVGPAATDPVFR